MHSPWHRSRLFWSGLPVLLLLLWMWVGYLDTMVHVGWTTSEEEYRLRWGGGEAGLGIVGYHYRRHYPVFSDHGTGFKSFREPASSFSTSNMAETTFSLSPVIGIYATAWLGGLVLWQKRKNRLMESLMPSGRLP